MMAFGISTTQSMTPADRLVPEDLAVTILINSRVAGTAFKAVQDRGDALDLAGLPAVPLRSCGRVGSGPAAAPAATCSSLGDGTQRVIPRIDQAELPVGSVAAPVQ